MIKELLFVGLGSFLGGSCRYLVDRFAHLFLAGPSWLGTFLVNIIGCFAMGLLLQGAIHEGIISPRMRLILCTGFCGGFTTFSTFIVDNANLLKEHAILILAGYLLASILLGFLALLLGQHCAKLLF